MTLARSDGIVIVRSPADSDFIERDRNPGRIIDLFSETPVGQFETTSIVDGTHKLFNYSQVGELPARGRGRTVDQGYLRAVAAAGLRDRCTDRSARGSTIALVAFLNRNLRLGRAPKPSSRRWRRPTP